QRGHRQRRPVVPGHARAHEARGGQTGGRFALWEGVLPHGAAPPLHSHPQDETFYVIEGAVTAWIVEPALAAGDAEAWVTTRGRRCGPGGVVFAPRGPPHTFRVE